ncbi:MAG: protoheme IX farnesyltransferase [Bacteroidales bacterium]|nr:protoheme IX farnesyltransferase [Bacteroidales bacterium]
MKERKNFLSLLAELNKVRITIAVTLTTLAGYTLAHKQIDTGVILPLIGIFILACGSAALNQYQERDRDILMKRTQNRPIPSGKISPRSAAIIAFSEIIIGTIIIYVGSNPEAALLGFLAFVWYNLIYTPLKRKTAFAVIPGSVIGSLPPVVGWVAGGGALTDPKLLVLAFFFFISQVPHFWLLMLKYGQEYVDAGYPSITTALNQKQIKRVTFVWTVATALVVLLMIYSGLITPLFFEILVLIASVWLIAVFSKLFRKISVTLNPFYYFMRLNYFVLTVIISLIIGPLI